MGWGGWKIPLTRDHHQAPSPPTPADRRSSRRHRAHSHWGSGQSRPLPSAKRTANARRALTGPQGRHIDLQKGRSCRGMNLREAQTGQRWPSFGSFWPLKVSSDTVNWALAPAVSQAVAGFDQRPSDQTSSTSCCCFLSCAGSTTHLFRCTTASLSKRPVHKALFTNVLTVHRVKGLKPLGQYANAGHCHTNRLLVRNSSN